MAALFVLAVEPVRRLRLRGPLYVPGARLVNWYAPTLPARARRDRRADDGAVEQELDRDAADPLFARPIEIAFVRAVVIDPAREVRADVFAEIVVHRVEIGGDQDAGEDAVLVADVVLRAACRADVLAAVVVLLRLMLADLVRTGREAGEFVLALVVGERRLEHVALRVEQVDLDAGEELLRILEVAIRTLRKDHAARDRAGQQLAKVVVQPSSP